MVDIGVGPSAEEPAVEDTRARRAEDSREQAAEDIVGHTAVEAVDNRALEPGQVREHTAVVLVPE